MATSRLPFTGNSSTEILRAILHHTPVWPRQLNPQLPARWEKVMNRALERDLERRYQFVSDMRTALKEIKRHTDLKYQVKPNLPAGRSSVLTRALLGVVIVAVLAFAGYIARDQLRPRLEPRQKSCLQLDLRFATRVRCRPLDGRYDCRASRSDWA